MKQSVWDNKAIIWQDYCMAMAMADGSVANREALGGASLKAGAGLWVSVCACDTQSPPQGHGRPQGGGGG